MYINGSYQQSTLQLKSYPGYCQRLFSCAQTCANFSVSHFLSQLMQLTHRSLADMHLGTIYHFVPE